MIGLNLKFILYRVIWSLS